MRRYRSWQAWGVQRRAVLITLAVTATLMLTRYLLLDAILDNALADHERSQTRGQAVGLAETYSVLSETELVSQTPYAAEGELIQIVDGSGRLLSGSSTDASGPPLMAVPAGDDLATTTVQVSSSDGDVAYVVSARGFSLADGSRHAVIVAVREGSHKQEIADEIAAHTPLLLLALIGIGIGTWHLVGGALAPVSRIRRAVDQISSGSLDRRITVPPSRDEIAALATTMNAMLDRLERADDAQRRFVSDASHELRSPIATIAAAAEVMRTDPDPTTAREMIKIIEIQSDRMATLVSDLLTLARADDHRLELRSVPTDLDDLILSEVASVRTRTAKSVRVELVPVQLHCDPERISQAMRNLLDNADRHAASTVRVSLRSDGDVALVRVDNDGPPIKAADRERVFERFVRLDPGRSRDAGSSGLGLAISCELVAAHGGRLRALEAPDGWCRFQIELPLDPLSHAPDESSQQTTPATALA